MLETQKNHRDIPGIAQNPDLTLGFELLSGKLLVYEKSLTAKSHKIILRHFFSHRYKNNIYSSYRVLSEQIKERLGIKYCAKTVQRACDKFVEDGILQKEQHDGIWDCNTFYLNPKLFHGTSGYEVHINLQPELSTDLGRFPIENVQHIKSIFYKNIIKQVKNYKDRGTCHFETKKENKINYDDGYNPTREITVIPLQEQIKQDLNETRLGHASQKRSCCSTKTACLQCTHLGNTKKISDRKKAYSNITTFRREYKGISREREATLEMKSILLRGNAVAMRIAQHLPFSVGDCVRLSCFPEVVLIHVYNQLNLRPICSSGNVPSSIKNIAQYIFNILNRAEKESSRYAFNLKLFGVYCSILGWMPNNKQSNQPKGCIMEDKIVNSAPIENSSEETNKNEQVKKAVTADMFGSVKDYLEFIYNQEKQRRLEKPLNDYQYSPNAEGFSPRREEDRELTLQEKVEKYVSSIVNFQKNVESINPYVGDEIARRLVNKFTAERDLAISELKSIGFYETNPALASYFASQNKITVNEH